MLKGSAIRAMLMGLAVLSVTIGGDIEAQAKEKCDKNCCLAQGRKVVIVHTNDIHGNLEPDSKGRGGLTRIATLIKELRQENPGALLYLDAGDDAQGTPVSNIFHGEPMFKAITLMGADAGTVGNHEYDWGLKVQKEMYSNAGYPIVAANVYRDGKNVFKPYIIKEVNGIKVGIIGIISDQMASLVKKGNTEDLVFADPAETCLKFIPKMYKDGAQLIVALSHCGVDAEQEIARRCPAIDIIVGGHSHTRVEPAINVGGHTWVVQADHYGRCLGHIDLQVNPYNGKIYDFKYELIPVVKDANIPADPEIQAIADQYNAKVRPLMEQVVGKMEGTLSKECPAGLLDSTLGNVICDALRTESGADIAVYNYGGIRIESLASGEVKLDSVFRLLPFDDPTVVVKMKGSDIWELMEQMVNSNVGPLQTSGLEVVCNMDTKTVTSVKVGGKDLDREAYYMVATTEFLAKGGDSYKALGKGEIVKLLDITRDIFVKYFKDKGTVSVPATGRVVIKNN
ncbi:bifunctional metallophosphatase/5'-nucleotidase [bacterium]|nr:bifunctional metallophosphatase/5'-nucleotidase [bacterium]